jgi:hypothetical protein
MDIKIGKRRLSWFQELLNNLKASSSENESDGSTQALRAYFDLLRTTTQYGAYRSASVSTSATQRLFSLTA